MMIDHIGHKEFSTGHPVFAFIITLVLIGYFLLNATQPLS
jgi:hypothetical protein